MATTYYNDIQKLYVAYFNRPADPAGLAYWETVVENSKGNTAAVSASFAASAEYKSTYANMTNAQVVNAVYQNLFGHAADAAGQTYWANLLDTKALTVDAVVTAIAGGAQGTDMTAYNNKVTAAADFTAALDTAAEQAGYNTTSVDLAKAYLAGVTTDATLAAAIAPAALAATVAGVVQEGTPFTVVGALQAVQAAQTAETSYLKSITDADASSTATHASLLADQADAAAAVVADLDPTYTGPGTGNGVHDIFVSGSAAVQTALINDAIAAMTKQQTSDQGDLTAANAAVAKVNGLSAAISTLEASTKATTAATAAAASADADLVGKEASFNTLVASKLAALTAAGSGATYHVDVAANGVVTLTDGAAGDAVVQLTKVGTGGVIAAFDSTVTEKAYPGITALISSLNTDLTAHTAVSNAIIIEQGNQAKVDALDVGSGGTAGDTSAVNTLITDMTSFLTAHGMSIAAGGSPTAAQVAAYAASFDQTDPTNATLVTHLNAYESSNPLYTTQANASDAVSTDADNLATLTSDAATLSTLTSELSTLSGFETSLSAAQAVFSANDYNLVSLTGAASSVASGQNDVFVVGTATSATISQFGLQGADSLFIGTGYTQVNGKLSTGSDSTLEAFVNQSGNNTTIQLEQHTFSSHVTNAATSAEIVTITLVGVTATDVHLDANGIITIGTPAA